MLYCGDLSIKSKRTPGRVSECVRQKEKETVLLLLISASDPYWVLLNKKSRKEAAKSCWNQFKSSMAVSISFLFFFFYFSMQNHWSLKLLYPYHSYTSTWIVHSSTHSFIHPFAALFNHSFTCSFIHSFASSSIIIIINVIFYSAFISTSQSASHRRKDKGVPLKDQNQRNGESILSFTWCINS